MAANYVLLERIELNASAIEDKLFDLARKGNRDAYAMLGYVLQRNENDNGCWSLDANNGGAGYTVVTVNKNRKGAHRLLLEILQESLIPEDLVVDHMCHNEAASKGICSGGIECKHRACFNPNHMEITTQQMNVSRGSKSYWNQAVCPSGHERNDKNTRYDTYNRPFCWECRKYGNMLFKREQRKKAKLIGC
jgi:hypothetical protein